MKKLLALASAFLIVGCAEYGGYSPTVDTYGDPYANRVGQDQAECKSLAQRSSGGAVKETVTGGLVGGAIGAAGGAIVGAFTGNPGAGAAIGAAAGGFGGGAYKGLSADEAYKRAYNHCMSGRGHRVVQ